MKVNSGADYPAGEVIVQITDNRVTASFRSEESLTDVGCATMRNIVQDVASSICDSAALLEGAWTIVSIDSCLNSDGTIRMRFSNASDKLRKAFHDRQTTSEDISEINQHPQGFYLRLALDDLNAALMERKFMHSHMFRAVESLRHSVAPQDENTDRKKSWEKFRTALGIDRNHLLLQRNDAERHGDFGNAASMSSHEVDDYFVAIADLIARYIRWFKATKIR